jgi:hypothetical protein
MNPPPFVAVGLAHRSRLARSSAALQDPASAEAQAATIGPDPVLQSQSGRPRVRMRRTAAVDEGRLLPFDYRLNIGHKAARSFLSGFLYHGGSKEPPRHRLKCDKRMFGRSYFSHRPAIRPSFISSAVRLPVQGGHSGRLLPPPPEKGG